MGTAITERNCKLLWNIFLQRIVMTTHISKFSRNGVKGGPYINWTASSGRICHVRQVTPYRHHASWNVRPLVQKENWKMPSRKWLNMNSNIPDMVEVKWMGAGIFTSSDKTIIYSSGQANLRGVGIIFDKQTSKVIKKYRAISDKVLVVKLQGKSSLSMCRQNPAWWLVD